MSGRSSNLPKQCCRWCHFLAHKTTLNLEAIWIPATEPERERLATQTPARPADRRFQCCRGVWSPDKLPQGREWNPRELTTEDRVGRCFFYPYAPAMSVAVAEELELRQVAGREAGKDRELTRKAFGISTAALAVAIATSALTLIWNCWTYWNPNPPAVSFSSAAAIVVSVLVLLVVLVVVLRDMLG